MLWMRSRAAHVQQQDVEIAAESPKIRRASSTQQQLKRKFGTRKYFIMLFFFILFAFLFTIVTPNLKREFSFLLYQKIASSYLNELKVNEKPLPMEFCPYNPPNNTPRRAFVMVVSTDNVLPGLLTLGNSIKKTSTEADVVVLVTENVCKAVVDEIKNCGLFEKVITTKKMAPPEDWRNADWQYSWKPSKKKEMSDRLWHAWTKLSVFRLEDYDTIIYLDLDTIVLRNVDELFDVVSNSAIPFAAAPDWSRHYGFWYFNTGVFVARPCIHFFNEMLEASKTSARDIRFGRTGFAEQPLVNYYFGYNTFAIPFKYNAKVTFISDNMRLLLETPKIVHFVGEYKPWKDEAPDLQQEPFFTRWKEICNEVNCLRQVTC